MKIIEYVIIKTTNDTEKNLYSVEVLNAEPFKARWLALVKKMKKTPGFSHCKYDKFS